MDQFLSGYIEDAYMQILFALLYTIFLFLKMIEEDGESHKPATYPKS